MATAPTLSDAERRAEIRRIIDRAVLRARLALLWEALWPRLVPALAVVGLFVLASLFGLWSAIPDWLRFVALALFAVAAVAALWLLLRIPIPTAEAAFGRLERRSGRPGHPATAVLDHLASPGGDAETRAIWAAHRARLVRDFEPPRAGAPSPGLARRDPLALRYLLILLLAVGVVASGGVVPIADAFRASPAGAAAAGTRIDAWASPPAYTGRPAIFLTGELADPDGGALTVPSGTELFVRVSGEGASSVPVTQTIAGERTRLSAPQSEAGPAAYRTALTDDATVEVDAPGGMIDWRFAVIPDTPPQIEFAAPPQPTNTNSLQIAYSMADDYGVEHAWAEIVLQEPTEPSHALYGPPDYEIAVPRGAGQEANGAVTRDLLEHPYAGLPVSVTLLAEDGAGQTGRSETLSLTLPERSFADPVARALIDQRRLLALDSGQAGAVADALDALGAEVENAGGRAGLYLALRSAYHRLALADSDDLLRGVVDYLWDIAIGIEGDPLADAAAALQAATDALREALARDADEAEIAQRTEDLREAMQAYLEQLANDAAQSDQPAQNPGEEREQVTDDQMEQLVDQIERQANQGDTAGAEQLLDQLEQMMQNLEMAEAQPGQQGQPPPGEQQLGELGELLQQQQALMDRTYSLLQEQNAPIDPPQTPEESARLSEQLRQQAADQAAEAAELQAQQQQLQSQLEQLTNDIAGEGLDPGGLPEAAEAMGEAAGQLGEEQPGGAVERQVEALGQLQQAAENLARQIGQQQQQAGQQGEPQRSDPLGRPGSRGAMDDGDVAVPDEIDRQLAREILNVIRERLNQTGRPEIELDYLERLLEID